MENMIQQTNKSAAIHPGKNDNPEIPMGRLAGGRQKIAERLIADMPKCGRRAAKKC